MDTKPSGASSHLAAFVHCFRMIRVYQKNPALPRKEGGIIAGMGIWESG